MNTMPAKRKPATATFTTGSCRLKRLDFGVLLEDERVPLEDERALPSAFLRTGFPNPGILILIATFMKVRRNSPTLMIDGSGERFVYLGCRYPLKNCTSEVSNTKTSIYRLGI